MKFSNVKVFFFIDFDKYTHPYACVDVIKIMESLKSC